MSIVQIDASVLYEMFANGFRNLLRMEAQVNSLNVFPVPDGDTGSNMVKTLHGGFGINITQGEEIGSMMKRFSKAVLLAARGNSGVILSQFIRGMADVSSEKPHLEVSDIIKMLKSGVKSAYDSVINPVEGTMLTVLREAYESTEQNAPYPDFESLFSHIMSAMQESLKNTPEKLPVLKDAGVVDSGGMGMLYIFEGMLAQLKGDIIEQDSQREDAVVLPVNTCFGPDSVLEYGYCTEFVLQLMNAKTNITTFSISNMISYLETVGDSIVAVQDDDIVKVHIHTFLPEKVLGFARGYGEFVTVKIENMSVQHNEVSLSKPKSAEKIKYAVVSVASGEGLKQYFAQIGAQRIIDGGQTNNPSTQDFLDSFASINAEHIVVLPNNSNILLTANQAAQMYTETDVRVLPTKSIPEGYSALSMMNTWADDIDSFVEDMTMGLESMISCSITQAVHDACIGGVSVKKGMYMGIANGKIICSEADKSKTVIQMLSQLSEISQKEVITVFYGENVTSDEADSLTDTIQSTFSHIECGAVYGGQKIYDYYLAIE